MLNRSAITIKAKRPFVDWILSLPESEHITQDDIDEDRTVYLLPDITSDGCQEELIQEFYQRLFEEQLNDWYTDEQGWPPNRDVKMFKHWFEIEFHSIVLDLVGDSLEDDEAEL